MRPVICAGSGRTHSAKTASPGCLRPLSPTDELSRVAGLSPGPVRGALASSDLLRTREVCAPPAGSRSVPEAAPATASVPCLETVPGLGVGWGRSSLLEWGSASAPNILGCSLNRDHSSLSNSAQGVPVLSRTAEPSRKNPSGLRSAKSTSFSRHKSVFSFFLVLIVL